MSWFQDLPAPGDEIAEGVFVERRSVLKVSLGAAAALLALGTPLRARSGAPQDGAPPDEDQPLSLEQFLERVLPLAQRQIGSDGKSERAYLFQVAALMSRLEDPAADARAAMRALMQRHGLERASMPLAAVQLRLDPGGGFAHHDHRDYNGVILGLQGEVRIRNYDILGAEAVPPKDTTFRIKETRDELITPGGFSSLARRRDNVHDLVAGDEGARVLDVFTFFRRGARSYFMDVEEQPVDARQRVYEAAWK